MRDMFVSHLDYEYQGASNVADIADKYITVVKWGHLKALFKGKTWSEKYTEISL